VGKDYHTEEHVVGYFLVIAHGTADEVTKAKSILETAGAAKVDVRTGIVGVFKK